jgi:hypothetical protein
VTVHSDGIQGPHPPLRRCRLGRTQLSETRVMKPYLSAARIIGLTNSSCRPKHVQWPSDNTLGVTHGALARACHAAYERRSLGRRGTSCGALAVGSGDS